MSRTKHHRTQRHTHNGYDYGGRFKCNKMYGAGYGPYSRHRAHVEMRQDAKKLVLEAKDL